jgi:hypothetical protein
LHCNTFKDKDKINFPHFAWAFADFFRGGQNFQSMRNGGMHTFIFYKQQKILFFSKSRKTYYFWGWGQGTNVILYYSYVRKIQDLHQPLQNFFSERETSFRIPREGSSLI